MNKNDIITEITPEIYGIEGEDAHLAAPTTGKGDATLLYESDTPHIIQHLIWYQDNGLSDVEKTRLMFDVYSDIPCYALVMAFGYDTLSPEASDVFWQEVRQFLSQPDDALAQPLAYMLWCDFFEKPHRCALAWQRLYSSQSNDYLLTRLLEWCGPVPYEWKSKLYEQKLPDHHWHIRIYESIWASYYNVYGDIDKEQARTMLARLRIRETKDIQKLRTALADGDRYANYYRDQDQRRPQRRQR